MLAVDLSMRKDGESCSWEATVGAEEAGASKLMRVPILCNLCSMLAVCLLMMPGVPMMMMRTEKEADKILGCSRWARDKMSAVRGNGRCHLRISHHLKNDG